MTLLTEHFYHVSLGKRSKRSQAGVITSTVSPEGLSMKPFKCLDIVVFSLEEELHSKDKCINCMERKTETSAVRFWYPVPRGGKSEDRN